uniref:Uncharacterized protein n=1 Tax=Sinocyclocheilus grahami TaxID=75366 RepID=A0A672KGJ3_SINGR
MSLVNRVYAGHHKTVFILLYLMFYSYDDTKKDSYAVAINVPRNQCQGNFDPLNEHFLTLENATCVRNAIYNTANQFYKGEDLMAAGPPCNCKIIENCKSKSVSVLLQNDSCLTFKNFLQHRENDSCIVIYTVYSPCLKSSGYNIIPNLENLKHHTGIKAFVFKKVYEVDENDHRCSDLAKNFTEIVRRVPFYRFVNKTVLPITNKC